MSHTHRDDQDLVDNVEPPSVEPELPAPIPLLSNADAQRAAERARAEGRTHEPEQQHKFRGDGDSSSSSAGPPLADPDPDAALATNGALAASGPPAPHWPYPLVGASWICTYVFDASVLPDHRGPSWLRPNDRTPASLLVMHSTWIAKRD